MAYFYELGQQQVSKEVWQKAASQTCRNSRTRMDSSSKTLFLGHT